MDLIKGTLKPVQKDLEDADFDKKEMGEIVLGGGTNIEDGGVLLHLH